jgi:hypothetical protein
MTMLTSTPATLLSSTFDAVVLNRLRHAHIRARLSLNRIDYAGISLRNGWIDGEGALGMIAEAGLLDFVLPGPSS